MLKSVVALALAVTATLEPPDFPVQRLLKDPDAARTFDYWRLRERKGPEAIPPLRTLSYAAMGLKENAPETRCFTEAETEIQAGLKGVESAASSRQWREDRDAAASAVRKLDQALSALMAGGSSGDLAMDRAIQPFLDRAKTDKTARGRELALRVAKDQAIRRAFGNHTLLGPLSPSAARLTNQRIAVRACWIDAGNVAWIKREVRSRGWFEISRYGREAEKDAWLLAQHADDDIAFQAEILTRLDVLRTKGETDPKNYAYLYDRVAANTGRPQRYGTQGGCRDGKRFTFPLEDSTKVDQLRAEVGLTTLAEYNARFTCRD
ncbi:MAG TPA: DUF6624 domain-containing protein [Caulobacter sp.]|nr:DUF6624 domain-containing protein [Caulobacter sp.]